MSIEELEKQVDEYGREIDRLQDLLNAEIKKNNKLTDELTLRYEILNKLKRVLNGD